MKNAGAIKQIRDFCSHVAEHYEWGGGGEIKMH